MGHVGRGWGAGTSAIVRALVAARQPLTQVQLAALVGVSQPRVSQVLGRLVGAGAVVVETEGYRGVKDALLDLYVERHRPALNRPDEPWYSVREMPEQIDRLHARARKRQMRVALSADLAPDLLAPWRHPTLTVVYADTELPLGDAGFVAAEGRVDATVLVRYPSDVTLLAPFEPWPRVVNRLPLVDPTQQVWDLHDLGGEDRQEAADRLRTAMLTNSIGASA